MLKRETKRFLASSICAAFTLGCVLTPISSKASNDNRIKNSSGVYLEDPNGDDDGITMNSGSDDEIVMDSGSDELDMSIDTNLSPEVGPRLDTDVTYYNINSDSYDYDVTTGLPIDNSITSSDTNPKISDNCYYDNESNQFVYSISSNTSVARANVANGMIVSEPVDITLMDGISYTLYRNGDPVENSDLHITESGSYVLTIAYGSDSVNLLSFKIVGQFSNLEFYELPSGFTVLEVQMGEDFASFEEHAVQFYNEGHYLVTYRSDATNIQYILETTIDRTPPTLKLSGVNNRNRADGPVDISDLEAGCKITINLDGNDIEYEKKLTDSGKYLITLEDEAGNINYYNFTIMLYSPWGTVFFILFDILLIGGIAAYVIYSKKHIRIR